MDNEEKLEGLEEQGTVEDTKSTEEVSSFEGSEEQGTVEGLKEQGTVEDTKSTEEVSGAESTQPMGVSEETPEVMQEKVEDFTTEDFDLFLSTQKTEVPKKEKVKNFLMKNFDFIFIAVLLILSGIAYFNKDVIFIASMLVIGYLVLDTVITIRLADYVKNKEGYKYKIALLLLLIAMVCISGFEVSEYNTLLILVSLVIFIVIQKRCKGKPKVQMIIFIVYIMCNFFITLGYSSFKYKTNTLSEAERVESYVSALTAGNYSECDALVNNKAEELLPRTDESVGTFSKSMTLYENMLDTLSKSIESINYDSKDNVLEVKYKTYKEAKNITLDTEKIDKLVESYVTNQLSDQDLETGLEEIYLESFDSMNKVDKDKGIQTERIEVSVDDDKMTGFKAGIELLLEKTNLKANMRVFEDNIKSTVNVELRK